jgi:hypothetical protein
VHGRLDLVCPVKTAYELHLAWPEMELRIVPGAGHSMYQPGVVHELLEATDRMKRLPSIGGASRPPACDRLKAQHVALQRG